MAIQRTKTKAFSLVMTEREYRRLKIVADHMKVSAASVLIQGLEQGWEVDERYLVGGNHE